MTEITVVQGDYGYDINFILQDANGGVFDLTGYSALLFRGQLSTQISLKFSGAMTVVSASSGTCKYTVALGNFSSSGVYNAEIQVTFASGAIVTFSDIQVSVQPKIPF